MVTQGILEIILKFFLPAVEKLPDINLTVLSSRGADTFLQWVNLAGYMFPFGTCLIIINIILALQIFRIVVSFFKNLWGVLPFM